MRQIGSRLILLVSVVVLIATSPDDKGRYSGELSFTPCFSDPLSLNLGSDNMSQEVGLTFENITEGDSLYYLSFDHTGTYSGQDTALLTISALDENGEIMEDQVIDMEFEVNLEQENIGVLDLNRSFLIEWDSSYEYSFDLVVTVKSIYDGLSEQCEVQWE